MTQIFFKELSLEEGFAVADLPKHSRVVGGKEVSLASGIGLYNSLRGQVIKCWKCGCVADRWVASLGMNDKKSKPVLNLYASRVLPPSKKHPYEISRLVMMTRDHIIPKSYGGMDVVENLRPGCEICNGQRGSNMNKRDLAFMAKNPHLICQSRAAKGKAHHEKMKREHEEAVRRRREQVAFAMKNTLTPYTFDVGYLHMMI